MKLRRIRTSVRLTVLALILGAASPSFAQGFEVGIVTYPLDGLSVGLNAVVPMFELNDVQHAARADVAYAFAGLPAISATYLLRGRPATSEVLRYLGAGVGISFASEPLASPLVSGHALAGMKFPLVGGLAVFSEVVVAGNPFGARLSLGAGVTFTFGGN